MLDGTPTKIVKLELTEEEAGFLAETLRRYAIGMSNMLVGMKNDPTSLWHLALAERVEKCIEGTTNSNQSES